MTELIYILGDGDRIRDHIDSALFAGDMDRLSTLSARLTLAVQDAAEAAKSRLGARVIVAGGDDIVLIVPASNYISHVLIDIATDFYNTTGCHISFGAAQSVGQAYINLRTAKVSRQRLVETF